MSLFNITISESKPVLLGKTAAKQQTQMTAPIFEGGWGGWGVIVSQRNMTVTF